MKFFSIALVILLGSGCYEQEGETINAKPAAAQDTASSSTNTESTEQPTAKEEESEFYPITETRPENVCGREGFEYLFNGYFVEECGTCHHADNIYNVSEFATRGDADSSFAEIISGIIDKEVFLNMVVANELCFACNLKEGDPLLEDVRTYMDSPQNCTP